MGMLEVALDPATVVVAVDPGKVMNRVWVSNGTGLLEEPVSLPVARIRQLLAPPPPPRRATKPTRGSKERRLETKRQRGQTKQLRGRVQD